MLDKLIRLLKEKHGDTLDLNGGQVHYLFLKDGLFHIYLDEDTKTLKVEVDVLPEGKTFIHHSNESLDDLL